MQIFYDQQLIDAWLVMHAGERDYTFFSTPHRSYSHIDLFLVPHYLLPSDLDTSIGNITWSVHAPIMMHFSLSNSPYVSKWQWRLNESLLQNPEVLAGVSKELMAYFEINDIPGIDPGIVWEAHKAVIRGVLIKHEPRIKKAREAQLTKLLADIQALEIQYKGILDLQTGEGSGPSPETGIRSPPF